MEDLFSIGEVSKYQHISKQTLIFYDKIGLFCPAYVDPGNGYRYYSATQLDQLDTILIMKRIGFSLAEIRTHLKHYTINSTLDALQRQLPVIDRQIQELRLIRSRVAQRCGQMENSLAYRQAGSDAFLEKAPAQHLLVHAIEVPYSARETSIATKACFVEGFEKGLPIYFQCGVIVPPEHLQQQCFTQATWAFLPIENSAKAQNIHCLPAGLCACIYHTGDYASIGRSYRKLLDFCQAQGLSLQSGSYEYCINDYITTQDESEYITKLCIYVAPQGDGTPCSG